MASKHADTTTDDEPLVSEPMPESFVQAVSTEYGQYIATGPLMVRGALAFTEGQAVPAGHPNVDRWLADGSIRRRTDRG